MILVDGNYTGQADEPSNTVQIGSDTDLARITLSVIRGHPQAAR